MNIKKASMIARDLMNFHGLKEWKLEFRGMKRLFGWCSKRRQLIKISNLLTVLNTEEEFINVVLHEIAHALAPTRENHGSIWKEIAVSIGCTGERCYNENVQQPTKPWIGTCPNCHKISESYRRRNVACGKCCKGVYNVAYKIQWKARA